MKNTNLSSLLGKKSFCIVLSISVLIFLLIAIPNDDMPVSPIQFKNFSKSRAKEGIISNSVESVEDARFSDDVSEELFKRINGNQSTTQMQMTSILETNESAQSGLSYIRILRKNPRGKLSAMEGIEADNFRRNLLEKMNVDKDVIDNYFIEKNNIDKLKYLHDWDDVPAKLKKYAPIVFKIVPSEKDPNFKTPCWNRRSFLRCLPYFYLLGMTKSGTSDLWNKTVVHPQIINTNKETHWWSHRFENKRSSLPFSGPRGESSFLFKYTTRALSGIDMPNITLGLKSKKVLGDGSPSTLWNNRHWRRIYPGVTDGPPYINADVIRTVTPNAKFLVILREPVSRLYSSYNFFHRSSKPTPEQFHEVVVNSVAIFEECLKENGLRACTYQPVISMRSFLPNTDFTGGLYHVYLEDWFRIFSREQILVLELNDWHYHCFENLSKVYKFLELDSVPDTFIQESCNQPTRVSPKKRIARKMLDKTKRFLEEKYNPYNEKLFELLKDDRFDWRYNK
ncbi:Carbohydrate sulfotransferase 15 [Holothuria leucospilota]|uniref:Carbohydrate sulfotransferase 15 n=1 Tax=Holothuria leucospilota TaxID=206669 RepID=A0A9Q1H2D8_HOLLE|nr:Carbohydrate sulfotransferase 15 [Holothuria leucospilota]